MFDYMIQQIEHVHVHVGRSYSVLTETAKLACTCFNLFSRKWWKVEIKCVVFNNGEKIWHTNAVLNQTPPLQAVQ